MSVDHTMVDLPHQIRTTGMHGRGVRERTRVALTASLCVTALVFLAGPATAAPLEVWSDVRHDTIFVQSFGGGDDPCGRGPVTETFRLRLEMQRLTLLEDGSFHFVDFETGLLLEDWADPAVEDSVYRLTNTFSANLTPGGVRTRSETFRQSDGAVTFLYRYHLTEVDGRTVVEKEVDVFPYPSACPA